MNLLVIVEGRKSEQSILSYVLPKYGFNPITVEKKLCEDIDFTYYNYTDDKDNIFVVEGPKNRIKDVVKDLKETEDDFFRNFVSPKMKFAGIFLIYDVDHNSNDEIATAFKKFNDESTGLLLLNSPCIEVLGDTQNEEFECKLLTEYKKHLSRLHSKNKISTLEYIKMNFTDIMIKYLKKNYEDFSNENEEWEAGMVTTHPEYLIKLNEKKNVRTGNNKDDFYCLIRYYSTVIYVILAFAKGFSGKLNSYELLLNYLNKVKEEEEQEESLHITKMIDNDIVSESVFLSEIDNDPLLAKKLFSQLENDGIMTKRTKKKSREITVKNIK